MRYVALALCLVLAFVPAAEAAHLPSCTDVTEAPELSVQGAYAVQDGENVEVWEETNGVDGLQREACTTSGGDDVDADTHHATVPQDAVDAAEKVASLVLGLVGTAVDLAIAICNAVVGLLGHYRCF